MRRQLAVGRMSNAQPLAELDDPTRLETDERRDGRVGTFLAEERALQLGVGPVEGVVVPIEAAAGVRDVGEQRQENRAEEGVLGPCARVRARIYRRGGLPPQRIERQSGVPEG